MSQIDPIYCSSLFLTYRFVYDKQKRFSNKLTPHYFKLPKRDYLIANAQDVALSIRRYIDDIVASGGRIGLALSGGIDSAILAKFVPKGTVAYTFKCEAEGCLDETAAARHYADLCGLEHKIVPISWTEYQQYAETLMRHKGAPIHSIEPQIYKACVQAKNDGVTHLLFGENADIIFGGMDGLLKKDWTFDEFVARYAYLDPRMILSQGVFDLQPFEKYRQGNGIDFYGFICDYFYEEANNSYDNACSTAGVVYATPFNRMRLAAPLDMQRIRSGESKYILRELFAQLYPNIILPPKTPMPRAVKQWLSAWQGPKRPEFIPHCTDNIDADRRWMVFILERFLNLIEGKENELL